MEALPNPGKDEVCARTKQCVEESAGPHRATLKEEKAFAEAGIQTKRSMQSSGAMCRP